MEVSVALRYALNELAAVEQRWKADTPDHLLRRRFDGAVRRVTKQWKDELRLRDQGGGDG